MLKNWARPEKPEGEELKQRLKAAEEKLSQQQMKLKEKRLPVLVLIEGWGAAGKGSAIGQIIKNIDPRFFKVFSMPSTPTEEERRRPFLYRFFEKIPEAGKFTFLDSGWMDQIMKERLDGKLDDKAYAQRVDSVKRFERGLTDNGYLVLKFFFHISKKEQENRIEALLSEKDTRLAGQRGRPVAEPPLRQVPGGLRPIPGRHQHPQRPLVHRGFQVQEVRGAAGDGNPVHGH